MDTSNKRYKAVCPNCSKIFYAQKSISMEIGLNSGHGYCPQCKTFLHLQLNDDQTEMLAEDFDIYLKKTSESGKNEKADN